MAADSFFKRPFTTRKRPARDSAEPVKARRKISVNRKKREEKQRAQEEDDDIASEGSSSEGQGGESAASSEEDEDETPAQKRLRLSKMYLEQLRAGRDEEDAGGFDAADLDKEIIAQRLQKDVLQHSGKVHLFTAAAGVAVVRVLRTPCRGNTGVVTGAVLSADSAWLYTCSKGGDVVKWRVGERLTRERRVCKAMRRRDAGEKGRAVKRGEAGPETAGHTDEILTLSLTEDGTLLATAGRDRVVNVWDVAGAELTLTRGLTGHRDAIPRISVRPGTHELFSASLDRTIKLFDLGTLSYIETLYGHQEGILDIHVLRNQNCVTVAGHDKTARYWKVLEESQLVFRGGAVTKSRRILEGYDEEEAETVVEEIENALESTCMLDDTHFVTGGDSGTISLWTTTRKKPIFSVHQAHGSAPTGNGLSQPHSISALGSLAYGDLFASGAASGEVKLWHLNAGLTQFELVASIPVPGFVNSLQLVRGGGGAEGGSEGVGSLRIVAAAGREHRLGRWQPQKARDQALIIDVGGITFL